jgi:hypothetical protein
MIAAGNDFVRAKEKLGHGNFLHWLRKEFPQMSVRTAETCMRIARLASEFENVSHLRPTTAGLLASRSVPKGLVVEVITDTRSGKKISDRELRRRIRGARKNAKSADHDATGGKNGLADKKEEVVAEAIAILSHLPTTEFRRLQEIAAEAKPWSALGRAIARTTEDVPG